MAKKNTTTYECTECGRRELRWLGRCPQCGSWNSFSESRDVVQKKGALPKTQETKIPLPLSSIEAGEEIRFDSGIEEINRVLGGGIIKGSTTLIGGEPGIGKSTLLMQIAESVKTKGKVLYVSGEESLNQLKLRASRLGINASHIEVLCETSLEGIINALNNVKPVLAIIDSIQTLHSSELGAVPGTVNQVKLCSAELNEYAKTRGIGLFLIGHVTKEGTLAGPKVVEHLVDTVLYFDQAESDIRILRAMKNRFGSTDEIGLFRMEEKGLFQVTDPSQIFLEQREGAPPAGVVIAPVYEGSRVLLVEIQSLVVPAKGGISRVFSDRIDSRRVSRLAAVLEKHLQLPFSDVDIYVNVAGGIKLAEVGIDLPVCLSLYSARKNLPLSARAAIMGEISLAGEIRTLRKIESRYKAAREMGYETVVGPAWEEHPGGYVEVKKIQEGIQKVFSL